MRVSFVAIKQVKKTIELQKEVGMAMLEQQGGRDDNNYNMHLYITYHDTHMHVCVCVCDCVHVCDSMIFVLYYIYGRVRTSLPTL